MTLEYLDQANNLAEKISYFETILKSLDDREFFSDAELNKRTRNFVQHYVANEIKELERKFTEL